MLNHLLAGIGLDNQRPPIAAPAQRARNPLVDEVPFQRHHHPPINLHLGNGAWQVLADQGLSKAEQEGIPKNTYANPDRELTDYLNDCSLIQSL